MASAGEAGSARRRSPRTRHAHTTDPVVAALDVVDPDGAHHRRQIAQAGRRTPGPKRAGAPEEVTVSYDRSLRAKLQRRYQALAKRNKRPVTPLPTLPDVQCLGKIADRLPGGRDELLEIIQRVMLVGNALATAWWTVYAELAPEERKVVNLDEVGLAAGVDYAEFIGTLVTTNTRLGAQTDQLVFSAVQSPMILAAAASGTVPGEGGFPDRQMILQGGGLVPAPKHHTTQVNVHASAQAAAAAAPTDAGRGLGFLEDVADAEDARKTVHTQLIEAGEPDAPAFEGVTAEADEKAPAPIPIVSVKEV